MHCGQLILTKISKIGAARCQILRLINVPLGNLQRSPVPLASVFKELTSNGTGPTEGEGERRGRGGEGDSTGEGGERRGKMKGGREKGRAREGPVKTCEA